ncbi:MAG TPA: hypothetical protein VKY74_25500 [Chloroflexia bacterium]|nr:hypothetical protein [Chloroflexia bacterium]
MVGVILADDGSSARFAASDIQPDEETGKPVARHLVYDYRGAAGHYVLTFQHRRTILRLKLFETIKGFMALLARLAGFDGAFLRFTGDLAIDRYDGEQVAESYHDDAIWELAYFGKVPKS